MKGEARCYCYPQTIAIKPADLLDGWKRIRGSHNRTSVSTKLEQALAEHQQKKLERLAHDIQLYGLDPSSLPIVMPYGEGSNRYLVLEGNRRLLALKALENPDFASGRTQAKHTQTNPPHQPRISRESD